MDGKNTTKNVVAGIICLVLGVLFLVFREQVFGLITGILRWGIAGLLWLAAVFNIIAFAKDQKKTANLVIGIILIIGGILLVAMPSLISWVVFLIIGVFLLLDGFFKIKKAITYFKAKAKGAAIPLCFGILNIVLGVLAIFYRVQIERIGQTITAVIVVIAGIILLVYGIHCLISGVSESKN